jgi:hypothetical protein
MNRDENGSDTDGYHWYRICFHIYVRIQIRIRIVSKMSDRIRLDIDIINMWFKYSDTNMVSDVKYPDSDTDGLKPSKRIRSRIRSENIRTVFIPGSVPLYICMRPPCSLLHTCIYCQVVLARPCLDRKKKYLKRVVALSFVFDNYCPTMV